MKIGVSIKLDVKKILKEKLYVGAKGTYLDLTTFIDTDQQDQYQNNGFVSQSISKEEKANGVQTPILGNCKVFWSDQQQNYQQPQNQGNQQNQQSNQQNIPQDNNGQPNDEIPF